MNKLKNECQVKIGTISGVRVFFQNEEIISLNNQMAENNTKAPTQKSGERLSDNSKTEDVRMSNITAAKGKHAFEFQLIYSCC